MSSNLAPGIHFEIGNIQNPVEGVATIISGLMGNFIKGPLNLATRVNNMTQFETAFGSACAPGSTGYLQVKSFFTNIGDAPLDIVRIASATAAKASHIFADRNGAPANTIKVEALNEGIWGNELSVKVENDNILTTTLSADVLASATSAALTSIEGLEVGSDIHFHDATHDEYRRIISIDSGTKTVHWTTGLTNPYADEDATITSMEFKLTVYVNGVAVTGEAWEGLSMNDSVSFFCEKVINDVSDYITVTDQKTVDTDYLDIPAVTATPTALTGGLDGLSDVDAADYVGVQATKTGKYAFDAVAGLFRICCPNPILTDVDAAAAYITLMQDLASYADGRAIELYCDVPYDDTPAEAVTFAGNFATRSASLFYQWLKVYENQLPYWLAPSSAVMGAAVRKDYTEGVFVSVGNQELKGISDIKYPIVAKSAEAVTLNNAKVNVIIKFAGQGVRVYGARTLSALTAWRFTDASEYFNYIVSSVSAAMVDLVFKPNNVMLWNTIIRRLETFLNAEWTKGALQHPESPTTQPFTVIMDSSNNTISTIPLGEAHCSIGYYKVGTAEQIIFTVTPDSEGLSVSIG